MADVKPIRPQPNSDYWIDHLPISGKGGGAIDSKMAIKPRSPNDDMVTGPQPEGTPTYMQHRKGGRVSKVMKKPKGYQHGGVVNNDTAPGAASASSHKWSANMAGRNVTMRAKGGKVNKVKKGRR